MNETTLINTLIIAIYDDATLAAWCTTNYGQHHRLYKGIDERDPPDPTADYPAINVVIERKKEGYSLEVREHEVVISGGLYDPDAKSVAREYLTEYEFSENLVTFGRYVKDIVKAADLGTLEIGELEIFYDDITFFPSVKFEMYVVFTEQYYQGDDPFD